MIEKLISQMCSGKLEIKLLIVKLKIKESNLKFIQFWIPRKARLIMLKIKLKSVILSWSKLKLLNFLSDKKWSKQRKNYVPNCRMWKHRLVTFKLMNVLQIKNRSILKNSKNNCLFKLSNCKSKQTVSI